MRRWAAWIAISLIACAAPAQAATAFADWAAVVVAGDWRGHEGGSTEAFDNARRDVSQALIDAGFTEANLRQFSVRPKRDRDVNPGRSDAKEIYETLSALAAQAQGGCLVYITSHGSPQGVVVGKRLIPPAIMGQILDAACGERPTVAVISACFSGVFVPALAAPNRMVLTAARPDRSSFGCGEADRYPYFDDCMLRVMPQASSFAVLGPAVQTCVAEREKAEGAKPPSEPQLWIGPQLRPLLPLYPFARPAAP